MEERDVKGISPYRMSQLVKVAGDISEKLMSGKLVYGPTYQECEIVVELVAEAIKKGKNAYRRK
ncbi:hypothetical protein [Sellimonas intestinalis]|uniref:hypothetical protein n=1 Tax=Sellimonas intestinalis TaxID=1653434 RepID=UPI001FAC24FD|nr:hypothetical protein [Sellimonas intestinalis]